MMKITTYIKKKCEKCKKEYITNIEDDKCPHNLICSYINTDVKSDKHFKYTVKQTSKGHWYIDKVSIEAVRLEQAKVLLEQATADVQQIVDDRNMTCSTH